MRVAGQGARRNPKWSKQHSDRVVEWGLPLSITVVGADQTRADLGRIEFVQGEAVVDDWGDLPFSISNDELVRCNIIKDYHSYDCRRRIPDDEAHNRRKRGHPSTALDNPQFLRLDASLQEWLDHLVSSSPRTNESVIDTYSSSTNLCLEVWPGGPLSEVAELNHVNWCKTVNVMRGECRLSTSTRILCELAASEPWAARI